MLHPNPNTPSLIRSLARSSRNAIPSAMGLRRASTATAAGSTTSHPEPTGIPAIQTDPELRLSAIKLYKELHRLGRDYPDPNYEFNKRLRRIFEKNSKLTSAEEVKAQLAMGEHVKKEILAMLSLKKFRHLRRSYYPNDGPR
ncbi:hypothetical protein DB88DRAFT_513557 [Papiliotrema laurentii]|uniref:Complex 1 LYR protein domain-containing protein n=1 Tax=Papiliotrema laurentii TaxID=5418 RepID=A0AAD9CSJ6_PAPLA|nr:hypothetical protein DB88DRAFT_513557 [Papiliotrema laurentii]